MAGNTFKSKIKSNENINNSAKSIESKGFLEIQYKNNVIGITSSLNSEYWLNKWKYLTLIYNPNRLLIYSNGQEVFDINYSLQSLNIDSGGLILGADQDSFGGGFQSNQFVKGLIDDVRIYDRALSAEEVQALYNLRQ